MRSIFNKVIYSIHENQDLVLVVIVEDSGSSPRGKGSMMLVGKNGYVLGTIGGGAIEYKAIEEAKQCIKGRSSRTERYYLSTEDKALGMACGGEVTVYFQYIGAEDKTWESLAVDVLKLIGSGDGGWLKIDMSEQKITVSETEEESEKDVAFLPVEKEERAFIFGGGHIALDLVPILKSCGFSVTVFDDREEYAKAERFPNAERVFCGDYKNIKEYISFRRDDFVAIVTNGHSHDFDVEEQILRYDLAYVGVIGSRKKTASVNARLEAAGISKEVLSTVHTPIGLDIKAVTPAEIAVSIAAEMIKVRAENLR